MADGKLLYLLDHPANLVLLLNACILNSWISECTFQYCALHYVTAFPGEAKHTCLLIPDTHRSKDGYCQGPTW